MPDPDTELWPAVVVSIWPFTGAPTAGVFRTGWLGLDNTGTVYACTVGGSPGTWAVVGSAAAAAALTAASVEVGRTGGDIGFYGVTPIARPSFSAVTTLAELLVILENLGLGTA
jgi:hypothetical protein